MERMTQRRSVFLRAGIRATTALRRRGVGLHIGLGARLMRALTESLEPSAVMELDGIRLHPLANDRYVSALMYAHGAYQPELRDFIRATLRPGDVFIDGGAHIGYFTCAAAQLVGAAGRVVAFEPAPQTFSVLTQNVVLNGLSDRCVLYKAALGREHAYAALEVNPENPGDNWVHVEEPPQSERVEVMSLSSIVAALDIARPRLIKLDIQGMEPAALEGMQELIAEPCDVSLIVEYDPKALERAESLPSRLVELLLDRGFSIRAHACTGEWIDVTMPDSLDGVARAGIWADLYCVRGQNGAVIGRAQGEAR